MGETLPHPDYAASAPLDRGSVVRTIEEQVARGERTLSPLGRQLLEARRRIEQSGVPLLDDCELEREKSERRGGVDQR
jgi:hypothetical protein